MNKLLTATTSNVVKGATSYLASVKPILISENKKGKDPNKAIDIHALFVNKNACLSSKCSVVLSLFDRKSIAPTNKVASEEPTNAGQSLFP